jgi:hypothetical protein
VVQKNSLIFVETNQIFMRTVLVQFNNIYKFSELQSASQNTAIVRILEEADGGDETLLEEEITSEWCDSQGYEFFWDGEIYYYASNEVKPSMKLKKQFTEAIYNILHSSAGQSVMNANFLLDWFEKEYNVNLNVRLNSNTSFWDVEKKILEL